MTYGHREVMRRIRPAVRREHGSTLIEVLAVTGLVMLVISPLFLMLEVSTRVQNQVQQSSLALQDADSSVAKMMREVRGAYNVVGASPSSIDFLVALNGVQKHVGFYCSVAQPGTAYDECVRVEASSVTTALPAPTAGAPLILRVQNGSVATYCNPDGSYSSSVFHFANAANPNSNGPCTEASEGAASIAPTVVQATLNLPAGGELAAARGGGLTHSIALRSAAYMRNLGVGS